MSSLKQDSEFQYYVIESKDDKTELTDQEDIIITEISKEISEKKDDRYDEDSQEEEKCRDSMLDSENNSIEINTNVKVIGDNGFNRNSWFKDLNKDQKEHIRDS